MKSANVSTLKNQLSAHLKTVAGGEPVLVTDRNKPVAVLQPLPEGSWDERMTALVLDGVVAPSVGPLNVKSFLRMPKAQSARSLTSAVIEDRDGR